MTVERATNPDPTTALHQAIAADRFASVEALLAAGADPNAPNPETQESLPENALHHSIRRMRDRRYGEALMQAGIDLKMPFDNHSPYALACMYNNLSMVMLFVEEDCQTELKVTEKLIAACTNIDPATTRELVKTHPQILDQMSPLDKQLHIELARYGNRLEALQLLHDIGLDPRAKAASGTTALHQAAWYGQADNIDFYLQFRPDLTASGYRGKDPLGCVLDGSESCSDKALGDYLACTRLLISAGAKVKSHHVGLGTPALQEFVKTFAAAS